MKKIFIIILSLTFTLLLAICLILYLQAPEKREVSFSNGNFTLRGSLYLPKGEGPFPAVVFVHGSGPETRDNSKYSAKWLASIGYAALTYDKRGAGLSDGEEKEWRRFNFDDLSNDAVAAVSFLSEQPEIDQSKIGVHASSQGGWIAPLISAKTEMISFMIIKSASVTSVAEDRIFERAGRLKEEGFSENEILEARQMQLVEAKFTSDHDNPDSFTELFDQYKDKAWLPKVYGGTDPFHPSLIDYRTWYATIYDFDPVPLLRQIDIPIFWIFGDPNLDQYGPVEKSIQSLEGLKASGKPFEIHSYQGQDHNVKEREYELELYHWLSEVNRYSTYKFKKH